MGLPPLAFSLYTAATVTSSPEDEHGDQGRVMKARPYLLEVVLGLGPARRLPDCDGLGLTDRAERHQGAQGQGRQVARGQGLDGRAEAGGARGASHGGVSFVVGVGTTGALTSLIALPG